MIGGKRTISRRTSPAAKDSPSFFFQDATPPSVMVGLIAGMANFETAFRAAVECIPGRTSQCGVAHAGWGGVGLQRRREEARRAALGTWRRACMASRSKSYNWRPHPVGDGNVLRALPAGGSRGRLARVRRASSISRTRRGCAAERLRSASSQLAFDVFLRPDAVCGRRATFEAALCSPLRAPARD